MKKLSTTQLFVLSLARSHQRIQANDMGKVMRAAARGLAHRSRPLLSEAPYHLWTNPRGPTYELTPEGEAVLQSTDVEKRSEP